MCGGNFLLVMALPSAVLYETFRSSTAVTIVSYCLLGANLYAVSSILHALGRIWYYKYELRK